jgi:hypothetical protein
LASHSVGDALLGFVSGLDRAEFQIGPHVFDLRIAEIDDWGASEIDAKIVRLRQASSPQDRVDALIHEIIEASNALRELKLKHRAIQILATDIAQALLTLEDR